MVDRVDKNKRSEIMALVKSKDTKPELQLRRALHSKGFRFRIHQKKLPGCPDLVFAKYKTVIFVHGCFWHRHAGCRAASMPSSNISFWEGKFQRTLERDAQNIKNLKQLGWRVIVVWECDLRPKKLNETIEKLIKRILR